MNACLNCLRLFRLAQPTPIHAEGAKVRFRDKVDAVLIEPFSPMDDVALRVPPRRGDKSDIALSRRQNWKAIKQAKFLEIMSSLPLEKSRRPDKGILKQSEGQGKPDLFSLKRGQRTTATQANTIQNVFAGQLEGGNSVIANENIRKARIAYRNKQKRAWIDNEENPKKHSASHRHSKTPVSYLTEIQEFRTEQIGPQHRFWP